MQDKEVKHEVSNKSDSLAEIRKGIDETDAQLLELLNRRAMYSLEVGKVKAKTGGPIFLPEREQALMTRLLSANKGPLPENHLRAIYREILSSSRALQRNIRVAYLGPEGTFSNMACLEYFGEGFDYIPMSNFADIFDAVENHQCELAIVPLENSLNGTVVQTLDLFASHEVYVQAEWVSRIRHSLMTTEESLASIRVVYSHPQPLGQCASWLRENLPSAKQVSVESTAAAAHRVANEHGSAAIGHTGLAERLNLNILAHDIEDFADNWTRFFVIGATPSKEKGTEKSSIVFALADKPGSLASVLTTLANAGINISKLESRPLRGERWKYLFFADLDCSIEEHTETLEAIREYCLRLRVLGSYSLGRHIHAPA